MTTQTEALKRIAAYPFSRAEELSVEQMREIAREALAQPEQELTNLERHERNVQQLFGTPQPKEPEQEPVAHSVVEPLRHDEYQRRVSVKWINQPVAGPLYTTPPQRKPLTDEQIVDWLCEEAEYTCGQWQVVIESDKPSFFDAAKEKAMRAHGIKGEA